MKYKLSDAAAKKSYALFFESGDEEIFLLRRFAGQQQPEAARFAAIRDLKGQHWGSLFSPLKITNEIK